MLSDRLNAGAFLYARSAAHRELIYILGGFVTLYKRIMRASKMLPDDEEKIRDEFIRYIYYKTGSKSYSLLEDYCINAEAKEIHNAPGVRDGYLDIKIESRNGLRGKRQYFSIECKRLNNKNVTGKTGLNAKYIKKGICRYKAETYSTPNHCNGMIGFVVTPMDIDANIAHLNNFLPSTEALSRINDLLPYEFLYKSKHICVSKRKITLYHLMLDVSSKICRL